MTSRSSTTNQTGIERVSGLLDRPRLLLVDDDLTVLRSLERVLSRFLHVTIVDSVERAEQILSHGESFDLIACDLLLPRRGGVEFYRGLRAAGSELADRLVFLSGYGAECDAAQAHPEVRCLAKPLDVRLLVELAHAPVAVRRDEDGRSAALAG